MTDITAEAVRAEFLGLAAPFVARLEQLDQEIAEIDAAVTELRKARTQLRQVVKLMTGESVNGSHKKKKGGSNDPSPEKLEELVAFLRGAYRDGATFYASGLMSAHGPGADGTLPIKNTSSLSRALTLLHERSEIRLDSVGTGGAKYFKVLG